MDTGIYTETLARLYLKQGFVEQALAIYRHLAQDQPENLQWQETVMALEQQLLLSSVEQPALSPGATSLCATGASEARRRVVLLMW